MFIDLYMLEDRVRALQMMEVEEDGMRTPTMSSIAADDTEHHKDGICRRRVQLVHED